ncbi:hypothetical protein [Lacticaseibacillus hulanensis]|jgi:hypothetical protein|uniref:hypothetical protein n=1 Tax=Lacticaseibacillus hulanensis TaxID=2493111 RepID=UPI000FD8FD56|nr:hypothetical protein [Lacticaseibacillus hulanensis]
MSESIFFNQGDAIASDFDFSAARRSGQIFKVNHETKGGLVVARNADGKFAVFYEQDGAAKPDDAGKSKYTVLERL